MKYSIIAATFCLAMPAAAQDGEVFTYTMFETAVQHVNLADCPQELAGEGIFCRMTMHNDAFHVFAFSPDGEQPLVGMRTWYEDQIDMEFSELD